MQNKMRSFAEGLKSLVLAALVVSAVWLAGELWFGEKLAAQGVDIRSKLTESLRAAGLEGFASLLMPGTDTEPDLNAFEFKHAYIIADDGANVAAAVWDGVLIDTAWGKVLETLRSGVWERSGTPVSDAEWEGLASVKGVFVQTGACYNLPVVMEAILGDAGASIVSDGEFNGYTASSLALAGRDGEVFLYLRDSAAKTSVRFGTGLTENRLAELCGEILEMKGMTACENLRGNRYGGGEKLLAGFDIEPDQLLCPSAPNLPDLSLIPGAGGQNTLNAMLRLFGLDPFTAQRSSGDEDGRRYFVSNYSTVSYDRIGTFIFRARSNPRGWISITNPKTRVETVYQYLSLAQEWMRKIEGAAPAGGLGTRVSGVGYDRDRELVSVYFDYIYNGVVIDFGEPSARLDFRQGSLVGAELRLLTVSEIAAPASPQPDALNGILILAAGEDRERAGGELLFTRYAEKDGKMSAGWAAGISDTGERETAEK